MDQVDRLILEVQGKERLKDLNEELELYQKDLAGAANGLRAGTISQQQFDATARQSAAGVLRVRGEIDALNKDLGRFGPGILQASYAVQDFTSVLAGGQGLGRAIASIQNNIPGLLMSLGAGGGLAGVISLVSLGVGALIPLVEKMWAGLDNKAAADAVRQRLRELQQQIEDTHKAFLALQNAPTDAEKLSAEGIALFLGERGNAGKARAAVAAGMSRQEAIEGLTPDLRLGLAHAEAEAGVSDQSIRDRAERETIPMEGETPEAYQERLRRREREMRAFRDKAREQAARVMAAARRDRAEAIVTGAARAGPEHAADRRRLLDITKGKDGFKELQAMTPERIAADEAEFERREEAAREEAEALARSKERLREARRDVDAELADTEAKDKENLQEWRQARQRRQREGRQADADMKHRAAEALRQARERPRIDARDAVVRETQAEGLGTPSPEQADEMASSALRNMQDGMNAQQAVWMAVQSKVRALQEAAARFQQQQQAQWEQAMRMQMGQDFSGDFSLFPPMWTLP